MKLVIIAIIIVLLLSACTTTPTAPIPTQTPTAIPVPPTATPEPTPTETQVVDFDDLPYDQQKTMIENRFEQGSQAFEALAKEDGNLEYYDGTWKTLEAMRNLNGEIIPWGESYDMVSEEGRSGILTNIMAGDEAVMEEHVRYFNIFKKSAEEKGVDSSNFNTLYMQFFPDVGSISWQTLSEKIGHYSMKGQIIVQNTSNRIFVINIETSCNNTIYQTYVKSENVLSRGPSEVYEQKAFDNGFIGVNSSDFLNYSFRNQVLQIPSRNEPAEQAWLEKILNASMEELSQKIASDPNLISEDLLYNIHSVIYPNY